MERGTEEKRKLAADAWAALDKWYGDGFDVRLFPEERRAIQDTIRILNGYARVGL